MIRTIIRTVIIITGVLLVLLAWVLIIAFLVWSEFFILILIFLAYSIPALMYLFLISFLPIIKIDKWLERVLGNKGEIVKG